MPDVFELRPNRDQLKFSFGGGGDPLLRVPAGAIVALSTEDCFGGAVRTVDDLPSVVCQFPYLNPVSGPIHVEGAEPGDALAVHFAEIAPARDWAVSTTFPHFGALTTTHTTAMLHDALEERVWLYDVDTTAGVCRFQARNSDYTVDLPLDRSTAPSASPPPPTRPSCPLRPQPTAATWTHRRSGKASPSTCPSTCPVPSSPSETATAAKAKAKWPAQPSRPP